MSSLEYFNSTGEKVLEYYPPDSVRIDRHFVLTQNRILIRNMPYMLLEKKIAGDYIAAVRLIDFHDKDGIVFLEVQELTNTRTFTLSWNMEYTGGWWLWSLADFENLTGRFKHN